MESFDSGLFAIVIVLAYMLGAIPFGLLLTGAFGAGDLRTIGSGNIGATNVLRTGRKGLAAATLLLDLAKGFAAVFIARLVSPDLAVIAGAAAVIGHMYPLWLRFRGGKGVATMMGIVLALNWMVGLAYALVWLGVLFVTRISSAGGLAAAASAPLVAWAVGDRAIVLALLGIAVLVFRQHAANIARIAEGTEPRIGAK